jgi:hypothetical protein
MICGFSSTLYGLREDVRWAVQIGTGRCVSVECGKVVLQWIATLESYSDKLVTHPE